MFTRMTACWKWNLGFLTRNNPVCPRMNVSAIRASRDFRGLVERGDVVQVLDWLSLNGELVQPSWLSGFVAGRWEVVEAVFTRVPRLARGSGRFSLICEVCEFGSPDQLRLVLGAGPVDWSLERNARWESPAFVACHRGDLDILNALLGVDGGKALLCEPPPVPAQPFLAVHAAVSRYEDPACLRALLRVDPSILSIRTANGQTPLMLAAGEGGVDTLAVVLEGLAGLGKLADAFKAEDDEGHDALWYAREYKLPGVVGALETRLRLQPARYVALPCGLLAYAPLTALRVFTVPRTILLTPTPRQ